MLFDHHTTHPNSVDVLCGNVCISPSALNIDYENEIAFSPVCPTFTLLFVYPSQKLSGPMSQVRFGCCLIKDLLCKVHSTIQGRVTLCTHAVAVGQGMLP